MKNSAVEFLNAIHEDPEIRKYMKGCALPEGTAKEDALVDVAAHFGYEITKEELEEAARRRQEELIAASSEAEAAIRELQPDELDQVAGGEVIIRDETSEAGTIKGRPKKWLPECEVTYEHAENCWWDDGCDAAFNIYTHYICKYNWNVL